MTTLTLSAKTANALKNFYGELIRNFYKEVKEAVPELGVRAPFRLEGVIDALLLALEPLVAKERELKEVYEKASEEEKQKILPQFRELEDTNLSIEIGDDRFDLAKMVFEKLGDADLWPKKVNKSTDPEKPEYEIIKVRYFHGSAWLEIGKAFGFDK